MKYAIIVHGEPQGAGKADRPAKVILCNSHVERILKTREVVTGEPRSTEPCPEVLDLQRTGRCVRPGDPVLEWLEFGDIILPNGSKL